MNVNTLLAVVAATISLIACSSLPQIPLPQPEHVNPSQTEQPTSTETSPSAPEITPPTESPAASKTGDQDGPTETNKPPYAPMHSPALQSPTQQNRSTMRVALAPAPSGLPVYDRDDWKHWTDANRDCQDARQEVLIAESLTAVTYRTGDQCRVVAGQWLALYSNTIVTEPGKLDVDHMVPLGNAHDSGAWNWSANRKEQYDNYLDDPQHLIAVTASANRSKGARGPDLLDGQIVGLCHVQQGLTCFTCRTASSSRMARGRLSMQAALRPSTSVSATFRPSGRWTTASTTRSLSEKQCSKR